MSAELIKEKLKASGIHFSISVIIFLGVLYLILEQWYPGIFFEIEGGWDGIKLMAAVDLVLGPSLTFIIFNHLKTKKEIIFDLSLIAIMQIGALVWGGVQVYSERPVALVFWENTFYTVTQDYFDQQNISKQQLQMFDSNQPLIIYAHKPENQLELAAMTELVYKSIPPYAQYPLFRNYHQYLQDIFSYKLADDSLNSAIREKQRQLENNSAGRKVYAILLTAKYKKAVLLMDESGSILAMQAL